MRTKMAAAVLEGLRRPSRSVVEIRCDGENYGDIMVGEAIDELFRELNVLSFSSAGLHRLDAALGIRRVSRYCCLGGGTLIFAGHSQSWLRDLQFVIERTEPLFTFGTGVDDPAFRQHLCSLRPSRRPTDPQVIEDWLACLRRFRFVSVRGVESRRILNDHGLRDVEVIGDPALYYARPEITPKRREKRIGINLSTYSQFWGDSQVATRETMVEVIRQLRTRGWHIELFPAMPDDYALAEDVIRTEGPDGFDLCTEHRNVPRFLEHLEALDLFVGVRLHTVIAACCVYTPAVKIGYKPKCYDFMLTMGLERFHLRSDRLEASQLIALIDAMYADLPSVQREQFERCQALRQRLLDFRSRVVQHVTAATNRSGARRQRRGGRTLRSRTAVCSIKKHV